MPVRLGGLLVFGGRRAVLSRAVIPSVALLELHQRTYDAMRGLPDLPSTTEPGRWTPHVTLARHLDDDQLAAALGVLKGVPRELVGTIDAMRRWDADTKQTWLVSDASGTS
ncbi:MAG: 2'-5' RNA ligase family protein [Cellulomonas sp.]|nr:2'-5' RNA ligase family protein [Cellulomonas sp.]